MLLSLTATDQYQIYTFISKIEKVVLKQHHDFLVSTSYYDNFQYFNPFIATKLLLLKG